MHDLCNRIFLSVGNKNSYKFYTIYGNIFQLLNSFFLIFLDMEIILQLIHNRQLDEAVNILYTFLTSKEVMT